MKKLLVVVIWLFAVALGMAGVAFSTHNFIPLIISAIVGVCALWLAVLFGEQKGKQNWIGRVIPEDELPREIYRVADLVMFDDRPMIVLRGENGSVIVCGSIATKGFALFSIKGEGEDRFFVPKEK